MRRLVSVALGPAVLTALLLAGPIPTAAQAVTVIVDGSVVAFDQPPIILGGRVLIPLRGVFERLGARVAWLEATRQIVARRGSTTVVLEPGVRAARVNGRAVLLDVPALIVGGRTLVPLRFVGQALGAAVDWDPARRIVYVSSPQAIRPPAPSVVPPAPQPVPVPPIVTPVPPHVPVQPVPPVLPAPPIQPAPVIIEGTVARVDVYASPPRLLVRADGSLFSLIVVPTTSIFLVDATTGAGGSAGLDQIHRGDHVRVTIDPQGRATTIRASYREVTGRLDRTTVGWLYLTDGRVLAFAGDVLIVVDGVEATRGLLQQGMEVTLRLNPRTGEVWEVRAQTQIVVVRPRIDAVSLSASGPLGPGATLVVTMTGTPGGTATFDVARLEAGMPMVEGPAGRYTGRRSIRQGEAVSQGEVTVRLRMRGMEVARAAGEVTIDGIPPEFTRRVPEPGASVTTERPTIVLGMMDRGPAGVNPASLRLWVNGEEVRGAAVTETSATYTPPGRLPPGRTRVEARVRDFAGNEASTAWTFTIEAQGPVAVPPPPRPPVTVAPVTPPPATRPPVTPPPVTPPPVTPPPPTPGTRPTPSPSPAPSPTPTPRIAPPEIAAPKPGDAMTSPLVVRGTATAGHRVVVTIEFQGTGAGSPAGAIGPVRASITSAGTWEVRVALSSSLPPAGRMTITAVAVAPSGARSDPARVVLTWTPQREFERP